MDMGSVICSLILFPVIGWLSNRPQDAFWRARPLDYQCDSLCWGPIDTFPNQTCGQPACSCDCGSGMWVSWDNANVILALIVFVIQGWLTGVVIMKFSTVLRAIAQSSTILAIYFVGDPLMNKGHAT